MGDNGQPNNFLMDARELPESPSSKAVQINNRKSYIYCRNKREMKLLGMDQSDSIGSPYTTALLEKKSS